MIQPGMGKYWLAAGGLGALAALCNPQVRRATGEFVNEFIWMWLQQQQAQSALLPPPQTLALPAPATTPRESLLDDYGAISAYTPDLDEPLARLVRHPAVILILGHRGSGKTVLAVRLQELLRDAAPPYAGGFPRKPLGCYPTGTAFPAISIPSPITPSSTCRKATVCSTPGHPRRPKDA